MVQNEKRWVIGLQVPGKGEEVFQFSYDKNLLKKNPSQNKYQFFKLWNQKPTELGTGLANTFFDKMILLLPLITNQTQFQCQKSKTQENYQCQINDDNKENFIMTRKDNSLEINFPNNNYQFTFTAKGPMVGPRYSHLVATSDHQGIYSSNLSLDLFFDECH